MFRNYPFKIQGHQKRDTSKQLDVVPLEILLRLTLGVGFMTPCEQNVLRVAPS
jgi:hypothetical protein